MADDGYDPAFVMPPPGPPDEEGKLRECANCGELETSVTLGQCQITQLYFCNNRDCRKEHWKKNKTWWRSKMTEAKQTANSGTALPVRPSHSRTGASLLDPTEDEGSSDPPERTFGAPFTPRDPHRHAWDDDNSGVNRMLWDASGANNLEIMHMALADGASPNACNPSDMYNWNSLHRASYKGAIKAAELLLASGADINSTDAWGKTALHLAAEMGRLSLCRSLIAQGIDVNRRNKNNQTALHYAARDGYAQVVGVLLEGGADPDVEDAQPWERPQMTALDYALENGNDDAVALLEGVTTQRSEHQQKLRDAQKEERSVRLEESLNADLLANYQEEMLGEEYLAAQ